MHEDGIDTNEVEKSLREKDFDFAYLIPSYHNPTGIVTSSEKRTELMRLFSKIQRSIIEDGFNEEITLFRFTFSSIINFCGSWQ